MHVSVKFDRTLVGAVMSENESLLIPRLPCAPGIFQFRVFLDSHVETNWSKARSSASRRSPLRTQAAFLPSHPPRLPPFAERTESTATKFIVGSLPSLLHSSLVVVIMDDQ